jgi:putative hydrolase of the HAD superfamily
MKEEGEKVDWSGIEAITFDVDANLYNYPRMMIPRLHRWGRYVRFLMHLTKARQIIRKEGKQEDFRKRQAEIVGELAGLSYEKAAAKIDKVLYNGWNVDFKTVKPYKGTLEFVQLAVDNGMKIAIITDYPPMKKLEYMGFLEFDWVTIAECEKFGELKPAPGTYARVLEALELGEHPERVIHIGDHYNYDVKGAKALGMKAAWLRRKWRFTAMPWGEEDEEHQVIPDLVFKDWRDLSAIFVERCGWKK